MEDEDDKEVLIVVVAPRDEPERGWLDFGIELLFLGPLMVPPAYLIGRLLPPIFG